MNIHKIIMCSLSISMQILVAESSYDPHECTQFAQEVLCPSSGDILKAFFVPHDEVKKVLLGLISAERESIYVAAYQLTDEDVAHALLAAHLRGVHIEIIADVSCLRDKFERILELQKQQVELYIYRAYYSIMHNKFFIFGNTIAHKQVVWTGSVNATTSGLSRNRENALVCDSPEVVKAYYAEFERLKEKIMDRQTETWDQNLEQEVA